MAKEMKFLSRRHFQMFDMTTLIINQETSRKAGLSHLPTFGVAIGGASEAVASVHPFTQCLNLHILKIGSNHSVGYCQLSQWSKLVVTATTDCPSLLMWIVS